MVVQSVKKRSTFRTFSCYSATQFETSASTVETLGQLDQRDCTPKSPTSWRRCPPAVAVAVKRAQSDLTRQRFVGAPPSPTSVHDED
jgi:hypothetical protein